MLETKHDGRHFPRIPLIERVHRPVPRVSRNRETNFLRHERERAKGVRAWIVTRKSRHGYWFLIRYQLCARFGVRAAYYICDPLISTSNPPTTHSCPGEPAFEAPRKPHFLATRIDYRDLPAIRLASIQPVLRRVSITRPSFPPSTSPIFSSRLVSNYELVPSLFQLRSSILVDRKL